MSGVRRFLVTADIGPRMDLWAITAARANWIEGREVRGRIGAESQLPIQTWIVTSFAEDAEPFLTAARSIGVTVEEIDGAGDNERYVLLIGEPGTGWAAS